MKTIGIINLSLIAVNQELALFNCENSIAGVIHTTPDGSTTVVLDGGHVLGMYDCPNCAIDELTDAYINLHEAEKEHGNYTSYKSAFNSGFASSRTH
ncbi:DNA breaking-rejoining protein [Enterobacter hormaechei]